LLRKLARSTEQQTVGNDIFGLDCYNHIETPMQQMARVGLGLLSKGLGRYGL
jgi:hypothetical protein